MHSVNFKGSLAHRKLREALFGRNDANLKDLGNLVGIYLLVSKLIWSSSSIYIGSGVTSDVESLNALLLEYANKRQSFK